MNAIGRFQRHAELTGAADRNDDTGLARNRSDVAAIDVGDRVVSAGSRFDPVDEYATVVPSDVRLTSKDEPLLFMPASESETSTSSPLLRSFT